MNQPALRRANKEAQGLSKLKDDESLQIEEVEMAMMESNQEPDVYSSF